jgi:hypothetical protein
MMTNERLDEQIDNICCKLQDDLNRHPVTRRSFLELLEQLIHERLKKERWPDMEKRWESHGA